MDRNNIFLTETRREVLAGESDYTEKTLANEQSRIRTRARAALGELIEVARSKEIENRSVFEPGEVGTLLFWILDDPALMPGEGAMTGGLVGTDPEPPEGVDPEIYTQIPEELQQYRRMVHSETIQQLMKVDTPGTGRFTDPREQDG